ncbi:MAG: hypothetical protein IKM19_03575 [Firmicutes bacterium]|nr:hypothetical protein [Bacillota bacterium]
MDYFRDCSHHYSGTFFMEKAGDGTMGNNYLSCDKPDIFFREFMYYEARGLLLFFTAIQVMIVAVAAFVVRWQGNKQ